MHVTRIKACYVVARSTTQDLARCPVAKLMLEGMTKEEGTSELNSPYKQSQTSMLAGKSSLHKAARKRIWQHEVYNLTVTFAYVVHNRWKHMMVQSCLKKNACEGLTALKLVTCPWLFRGSSKTLI